MILSNILTSLTVSNSFTCNYLLRLTYFCNICPFWRIFQRYCIFVSIARTVVLWVSKSISWLQRTSLRCFWNHKRCFWRLFMQGKSTFSMQKVHWKSEISDDSLEFIDFVSWRMKPLSWLIDIICWLWKCVTSSSDFTERA